MRYGLHTVTFKDFIWKIGLPMQKPIIIHLLL